MKPFMKFDIEIMIPMDEYLVKLKQDFYKFVFHILMNLF